MKCCKKKRYEPSKEEVALYMKDQEINKLKREIKIRDEEIAEKNGDLKKQLEKVATFVQEKLKEKDEDSKKKLEEFAAFVQKELDAKDDEIEELTKHKKTLIDLHSKEFIENSENRMEIDNLRHELRMLKKKPRDPNAPTIHYPEPPEEERSNYDDQLNFTKKINSHYPVLAQNEQYKMDISGHNTDISDNL